jgi:hypothetical protein
MYDDPKHINTLLATLNAVGGLAIVFGLPISMLTHILSIIFIVSMRKSLARSLTKLEIFAVSILISVLYILRWDPYNVFAWFLD